MFLLPNCEKTSLRFRCFDGFTQRSPYFLLPQGSSTAVITTPQHDIPGQRHQCHGLEDPHYFPFISLNGPRCPRANPQRRHRFVLWRTRQESVFLPRHFPAHGGIKCNGFPPSITAHPARAQLEPQNASVVGPTSVIIRWDRPSSQSSLCMPTLRSLLLQGVQFDTTEDTYSRFIRTH